MTVTHATLFYIKRIGLHRPIRFLSVTRHDEDDDNNHIVRRYI